jgi:hypothetical protein
MVSGRKGEIFGIKTIMKIDNLGVAHKTYKDYLNIAFSQGQCRRDYWEDLKGKLKLDIDDYKEFYEKVYNLEVD